MEAMRQSWTDERLDDFRGEVNRRFDSLEQSTDRHFDKVEHELHRVNDRLDFMVKALVVGMGVMTTAFIAMAAAISGA